MRKILVITHFLPWPIRQASWHRNMGLLEHLREQGHRVDLLVAPQRPWARSLVESFPPVVDRVFMNTPTPHDRPGSYFVGHIANAIRATRIPILEAAGRRSFHIAKRLVNRAKQRIRTVYVSARPIKGQCAVPGFPFTEGQHAKLRELLAEEDYDTIIVGNTLVTPLVSDISREGRQWLVDTNDCFHQRAKSMRENGIEVPDPVNFTRQQETGALGKFDVIIAIQKQEAMMFREMLPGKQTICVGMTSPIERLPNRGQHVTIVGAKSPVNAEGAVRVLNETWPRVLRDCPGAVLDIFGGLCNCDEVREAASPFAPSSVVLHGEVDDLKQAYHCDVVLAPLWVGSGLKLKVVEALCHGKPVVTTSVGAQGLDEAIGSAMLVNDRTDMLAEHLISLLGDEKRRRSLADAAYAFAMNHFTPERVYGELDQVLSKKPSAFSTKASQPGNRSQKEAKVA